MDETASESEEQQKIRDILDRFQQKWDMDITKVAGELGITRTYLSMCLHGKRSGKTILPKLLKLADDYDLYAPEPEEDQSQKRQLQLVQKLNAQKVHPLLLQWAYNEMKWEADMPFLAFLGDEWVVKMALEKRAQEQAFYTRLFALRSKTPQLSAPAPARALPSPRNTVTITEEPIVESSSSATASQYVRYCHSCGKVIQGVIYEVPAEKPTEWHEYDYYCEKCEWERSQQIQAQTPLNSPRRKR